MRWHMVVFSIRPLFYVATCCHFACTPRHTVATDLLEGSCHVLSAATLLVMLGSRQKPPIPEQVAHGLAEPMSPDIPMQSDCVSFSGYRQDRQRTVRTAKGPPKPSKDSQNRQRTVKIYVFVSILVLGVVPGGAWEIGRAHV